MKINISKENVVNVAKTVGGFFALGVLARYAPMFTSGSTRTTTDYFCIPSYSEAVKVIMEEFTFDSSKNEAIKELRRDGDTEYYAAVIEAVRNTTLDSGKIQIIKTLSEK